MRRTIGVATGAALVVGVLSGCANSEEGDASAAAQRFYRAVQADDGADACALLAPKTKSELEKSAQKPCDQAILGEDIPPVRQPQRIKTFGTMAKLSYGADTAFLARFQGGWKVMAAGCTAQPGKPYDCQVSGG